MGKIKTTLKICLPTIVIGASGVTLGKCTNGCAYEVTKYELKIGRISCDEAKRRLKKLRGNEEHMTWKYLKGKYGEIEAYDDYIYKKCQK